MPNLPTVTVNDPAKWDRLLAAFQGDAAEYKAWLTNAVKDEVLRREAETLRATMDAEIDRRREEVQQLL